jgi:hypothetical protein
MIDLSGQFGSRIVLNHESIVVRARATKVPTRCVFCGDERLITIAHLLDARNKATRCIECQTRYSGHTTKKIARCIQCYDMPHRRPVVGACACGGRFAREEFGPAEMYRGRSRIADCEGVI